MRVRAIHQFIRSVEKILNYGRYIEDIARRLKTDGFCTGHIRASKPLPPDKIEGPRQQTAAVRVTATPPCIVTFLQHFFPGEMMMGRGILLWLIGVPIPIIILLALFVR